MFFFSQSKQVKLHFIISNNIFYKIKNHSTSQLIGTMLFLLNHGVFSNLKSSNSKFTTLINFMDDSFDNLKLDLHFQ